MDKLALRFQKYANQIPYATSRAINDAVEIVRDKMRGDIPKYMIVRNKFTLTGLRTVRSSKKKLTAEIGHAADWMRAQAEGGEKKPTRGKFVAVPQIGSGRPRSTKTARAQLPSKIFSRKKLIKTGNAVYLPDRRGRLKMLYALSERAVLKKNWPFYEDTDKYFRKKFPALLIKHMLDAIKTAK